ncbi:hypothetical protein R1sor_012975 [Riccia sorocarpa]|uniref:Uncharacterized protein n=1 Tax=Riccia sorocarpa TaxID=122646 RepID=A0ABD3IBH1_9MARC
MDYPDFEDSALFPPTASPVPSPTNPPAEDNHGADPGFHQRHPTPPAEGNQQGSNISAGGLNSQQNAVPDIAWDESDNEAAIEEDTSLGSTILGKAFLAEAQLARSENTSNPENTVEADEVPATEEAANPD